MAIRPPPAAHLRSPPSIPPPLTPTSARRPPQVFGAPDGVKGALKGLAPDKCAVLGMSKAFKLTGIDDVGGDELSYKVR